MSLYRNAQTPRARMILVSLVASAGLSGCATMGSNGCADADWYAAGLEDGTSGQSLAAIDDRLQRCDLTAADIDQDAYNAGRTDGLKAFCTSDNGLELAKEGSKYAGVCPLDVEGDFLTGYRLGKQIHRVKIEMAKNRHEAGAIEKALDSDELASVERDGLRKNLNVLERDFGSLESRMERLSAKEFDIE